MLVKFEVENFKNFKEKVAFDLSCNKDYEFNKEVVSEPYNCITKGIVFGPNGSGKSNLGLAVFDIVAHLTGYEVLHERYSQYLNLDSEKTFATFTYTFRFEGHVLRYEYKKKSLYHLLEEKVVIDDKEVVYFNYEKMEGFANLSGAEYLKLLDRRSVRPVSLVKYLLDSLLYDDDETNKVFLQMGEFVKHMLLFYSLDERGYQGFRFGRELLAKGILENSTLPEFEEFLREAGLQYSLTEKNIDGERQIYCHYKNSEVNLFNIASTGTRSLILFYYWYLCMKKCSFVFIDEFDAFYHFKLAQLIVKKLRSFTGTQVILTTHNTDLMSNELLRPDCYFEINNHQVVSFADSTDKELRKAHNLQKMYKAGAFE